MKRFCLLFTLAAAMMLVSCVDDEYDLSNIDSDNITIGGDESEFLMPLAEISYAAGNIKTGSHDESIIVLYDQINNWVPSTLPDGAEYIDLQKLNEKEYKLSILNALFAEMIADEERREAVCAYILDAYKDDLIEALRASKNTVVAMAAIQLATTEQETAVKLLSGLFVAYPDDVHPIFDEISDNDLIDLSIDDVYIEIPAMDISDDVEAMLTDNIDSSSESNPVNALYLFGKAYSDFPVKFSLRPYIEFTNIDLGNITIDKETTTPINEVRIYSEDLLTLFNGSRLIIPITLDRYYPNAAFSEESKLDLSLSLRKTGGLTL